MINSISPFSHANPRANMFSKIDANSNGAVSKEEFIAARPKNVSETKASELFAKIDTKNAGSITEDQFNAGMAQNRPQKNSSSSANMIASAALNAIMQLVQQSSANDGNSSKQDDLFAKIDANSDGKVSKDEFVNARPENVTQEKAESLWAKLDTQKTNDLGKDEFETAMKANAPKARNGHHGGPPPAENDDQASNSNKQYNPLDTNKGGKVSAEELLAGLDGAANSTDNSSVKTFISTIESAIKNYATTNNLNLSETILLNQNA